MSTTQDVQTLDEALNKTDLGHIINENKTPIMIVALLVVIAIIAYSATKYLGAQNRLAELDLAYDVEQSVFNSFLDDKSKSDVFLKALNGLKGNLIGHPNLVPAFIASINKLDTKEQTSLPVVQAVQNWVKHIKKSNFLHLFLSVRLSALFEDRKEYDQAISTLEALVGNKSKILKDKIHFDLGRLYLKKGDKETARERFDVLIGAEEQEVKQNPSEYSVLAKMYLSEL